MIKVRWNITLQALAIIVQALNASGLLYPGRHLITIAVLVAIFQAALAIAAHCSNPDGTSCAMPYVPPIDYVKDF